jgi:hypothetical protein
MYQWVIMLRYVMKSCHVCADNYTLVTAMIDIGRSNWTNFRRSTDEYLQRAHRLLSLNVPLVIFAESKFIDYIARSRRGKENVTRIITVTLSQLDYYDQRADIERVQKKIQRDLRAQGSEHAADLLGTPEVLYADYVIVMANKLSYFVDRAITLNPFNSSFFYWIDFGIAYSDDVLPLEGDCWAPRNIMNDPQSRDKVSIVLIEPLCFPIRPFSLRVLFHYYLHMPRLETFEDFERNRGIETVAGGFFGGQAHALRQFRDLFRQNFEQALANGYTDDDQPFMALSYIQRPDLFFPVLTFHRWGEYLHVFH